MEDFRKKEDIMQGISNSGHMSEIEYRLKRDQIELLCDIRDVLQKILYKN